MVETYNQPIHSTATIEINFSFELGELHTNIWGSGVNAWLPYPDTYPINGGTVIRGSVIEIKIPLTELANTTYFNPTFVDIWDNDSADFVNSGCDPTSIYCVNDDVSNCGEFNFDECDITGYCQWDDQENGCVDNGCEPCEGADGCEHHYDEAECLDHEGCDWLGFEDGRRADSGGAQFRR